MDPKDLLEQRQQSPLVGRPRRRHSQRMIGNDDELFARFGLPRVGEVDSEIIFRLLDMLNPASSNGTYLAEARDKVRLLEGTFATLSVDLRRPTGLLVTKNLMPLCLHYEERLGGLFFSSRYLFLRKAFGCSVITEALESGQGFYFDAERLIEKGQEPVQVFALSQVQDDSSARMGKKKSGQGSELDKGRKHLYKFR